MYDLGLYIFQIIDCERVCFRQNPLRAVILVLSVDVLEINAKAVINE